MLLVIVSELRMKLHRLEDFLTLADRATAEREDSGQEEEVDGEEEIAEDQEDGEGNGELQNSRASLLQEVECFYVALCVFLCLCV